MADAMPCGKIPVMLNMLGALGKIYKGQAADAEYVFTRTESSLILDSHYTWTV